MPFDASCPDCKIPGDDCPLGKLNFFIYSILNIEYLNEINKVHTFQATFHAYFSIISKDKWIFID